MIKNELELVFEQRELNAQSKEKRLFNINSFSELNRNKPLEFGITERLLLLHTTRNNEKIYIRYPGKEAAREKNKRPLDFRPVSLSSSGIWSKNLSFGDIWDDITAMHNKDKEAICELAALFFRMAYMVDYQLVEEELDYIDINVATNKQIGSGKIKFKWYKPNFSENLLNYLESNLGKIRDVSLEAYLFYNDLLVQNEDCKYYYRNKTETPDKPWNSKNGRLNTILSHLSVIEYLQGKISFSEITMRFQRGMGVAPISIKEVEDVTNGIIKKKTGGDNE